MNKTSRSSSRSEETSQVVDGGDDSSLTANKNKVKEESGTGEKSEQESLLARIQALEEENAKLVKERDQARNKYKINAADVYANLKELQENLLEKAGTSYEKIKYGLKDKTFDLKPFFEQARASYGLDSAYARALSLAPPKRRQLLACIITFLLLPACMSFSVLWLLFSLFFDKTRVSATALVVYAIYIYRDNAASHGSKARMWFKKHGFWKTLADYFPVLLLKQSPDKVYDPKEKYMFGYHPHGIISVGCFVSFAADATGVSEMFPGINIHPATLSTNFHIPIWREILLWLGVIDVSAKSIEYVLEQGPGNAVLIVPGGAAEALDAHPGTHTLTLNKRSGFFRIALKHGASLVPIYAFGENDLYEQAPNDDGSLVRNIQTLFLKYAGFSLPFFSGAGSAGQAIPMNPIPHRCPIITIVGDPIKCPCIEDPTKEDIDNMRRLYVARLQEIFAKFADKYAPTRSNDLNIAH